MVESGRGLYVAIDMHLIPRYDKIHDAEMVGSKRKAGTNIFERYITTQCVMQDRRLILDALHMPALENAADFVRKITGAVHDAGSRFFAADITAALDAEDIGCLCHAGTPIPLLLP